MIDVMHALYQSTRLLHARMAPDIPSTVLTGPRKTPSLPIDLHPPLIHHLANLELAQSDERLATTLAMCRRKDSLEPRCHRRVANKVVSVPSW